MSQPNTTYTLEFYSFYLLMLDNLSIHISIITLTPESIPKERQVSAHLLLQSPAGHASASCNICTHELVQCSNADVGGEVGEEEGTKVGVKVGRSVVGESEGDTVGATDGNLVGARVGVAWGLLVGSSVGRGVGHGLLQSEQDCSHSLTHSSLHCPNPRHDL